MTVMSENTTLKTNQSIQIQLYLIANVFITLNSIHTVYTLLHQTENDAAHLD